MSWKNDEAFVEALSKRRYVGRSADGKLDLYLSDGLYLYMFELWADGIAHASPEELNGGSRIAPTEAVLEKARRLQALALDRTTTPEERQAAWLQFEKMWKRYELPVNFGIGR